MEVVTTAAAAEAEGGGGGSGGAAVEPAAAAVLAQSFQVDEIYEFSAPRFFDFSNEETAEQIKRSELWFETALSHAQSRRVSLSYLGSFALRSLQSASDLVPLGRHGARSSDLE